MKLWITIWTLLLLPLVVLSVLESSKTKSLPPEQPSKPIVEAKKSVVLIMTRPGSRDHGGGCIVSADGLVVTFRHIVTGAESLIVIMSDGTPYKAKFVRDNGSDLALIQIDSARVFTPLKFADSEKVNVGDECFLWGHPFSYSWSLSRGIVAANDRTIELPNAVTIKKVLQVDPVVYPGSSGGPLLNPAGEIVGMVVAVRQDAPGIGFAIRASVIKEFLDKR